jgi:hypothetical protein
MNIKLSSEKRKRNNEDKTILKNEVTCMNVIGGKPELTTGPCHYPGKYTINV